MKTTINPYCLARIGRYMVYTETDDGLDCRVISFPEYRDWMDSLKPAARPNLTDFFREEDRDRAMQEYENRIN